ncbi:hypothetical protein Metev_0342 [Methanohalobium evestigatum Z-7303]|uniref:Uncharacterized protein n=1 Tax=Methanohalobium evestigatum (strain ATCC BAA-1072 / DSM 3721 / NBRC 107634 / OCM 161 / Z-7303) TaxID=644295 RepID=D7E6P5_METEZ|nr:hypothetical protein [Methanohalobium evestigatum]ADI73267.1 hypothetical protein Metev_0342 [Methanohalobium evestigatum Z-7303]
MDLEKLIESCGYGIHSKRSKYEYNKNFDSNVEVFESTYMNKDRNYKDIIEPEFSVHMEQPGFGKTESMIDYIKSNPNEKHLILGPSHAFLE